jgi:hypothetical protein
MAKSRTSGQGRPKGVPNKLNASLREMILSALSDAGGTAYLARQAEASPAAFMALLGRVLPLQMAGDGGGPVTYEIITGVPRWNDPEEESHSCDATRDAG